MDCLRRSLRELPHSQPSPVVRAIQSLERRVPWGALLERTGQGRGEMTQSEPMAGEARTAGPGTGLFALAGGRTYSWCLLQVPMVAVAQDRERETSMVVAASRDFTGDWQIPESGADSPGTSDLAPGHDPEGRPRCLACPATGGLAPHPRRRRGAPDEQQAGEGGVPTETGRPDPSCRPGRRGSSAMPRTTSATRVNLFEQVMLAMSPTPSRRRATRANPICRPSPRVRGRRTAAGFTVEIRRGDRGLRDARAVEPPRDVCGA